MMRLLGILFLGVTLCLSATADEKKPDEKKPEKKSGTVTGTLTAKSENWIDVKADGEEKARRYTPNWIRATPSEGAGLDKKVLAVIKDLKVGSRLRVEWEFNERPRVVKVEVLKPADDKKDK